MADMNAHLSAEDIRGRFLAETINVSEFGVLNEDILTRITTNFSFDFSLATAPLHATFA